MHLHLHLKLTIIDYGPLYAYWLFAYERYNGYLKEIKTIKKNSFKLAYLKRCFCKRLVLMILFVYLQPTFQNPINITSLSYISSLIVYSLLSHMPPIMFIIILIYTFCNLSAFIHPPPGAPSANDVLI
ncbi:hypothetical protein BDA99DRAFT_250587 [Phascolomyces articulosus]|uniref:Uncharacterized protein n=1 Tax=Phascolomyces articulosus TaxID=60185 RepID=A0AAD5JPK7_9FUNG|nr:hypothetical protein BDA99DRAFT_250587 [Phascolomyces articulosus]